MLDLNDLMASLETAKQIAIENGNANALVSATMAQAKLLGLDKPQMKDANGEAVDLMADLIKELSNK